MKAEEQIETVSRRSFLQALPNTWFVRLMSALLVLALCVWAAEAIWNGRDLIAVIIIATLVIFGIRKAIELFPVPKRIQSYLAEQERLSNLYLSHRYKSWLWFGLATLLHVSWRYYNGHEAPLLTLVIVAVFLIVGLVATIIWHLRHRKIWRVT